MQLARMHSLITYNDNSRMSAYRADCDAADDRHHVAGPSESIGQEEYTGADRALQ